jgi:hypothetical protein
MQLTPFATARETGKRVREDIGNHPQSTRRSLLQRQVLRVRRLYRESTLRIALIEIGNLPHRIRWVSHIREAERLRGSATIQKWLNEALIPAPESRQSDCIAYIRKTLSLYPFLSIFDGHLLTKSWIAGSEWSSRNACKSHSRENSEPSSDNTPH